MLILIYFRRWGTGLKKSNGVSTTNIGENRINLPAASHDKAHWGHRGALASCGVLDRMAGGWLCVLAMGNHMENPSFTAPSPKFLQYLMFFNIMHSPQEGLPTGFFLPDSRTEDRWISRCLCIMYMLTHLTLGDVALMSNVIVVFSNTNSHYWYMYLKAFPAKLPYTWGKCYSLNFIDGKFISVQLKQCWLNYVKLCFPLWRGMDDYTLMG